MCNLLLGFQLCTCGNNQLNADWQLTFNKLSKETIYGSTIDMDHIEQLPTQDFILDKLNNLSCFDFEYTPKHKDKIEWKEHNKTTYTFYYNYDKWVKAIETTSIFGFAIAS